MSLFFIVLTGVIIVSSPLFVDYHKLKEDALEVLHQKTDLKIEYAENQFKLFPYPGLEFHYLTIKSEKETLLEINKLLVQVNAFKLILGEIDIFGIHLDSGRFHIIRNSDGNLDILTHFLSLNDGSSANKPKSYDISPSLIYEFLPKNISFTNIHVNFQDRLYKKDYEFYFWNSDISTSFFSRSTQIDLYGKVNNKKIEIYSNFYWDSNEFSYESLRLKGTIIFDKFNVSLIDDILVIFPYANFHSTILTGKIYITKNNDDFAKISIINANLKNFQSSNGGVFGNLIISTLMSYSLKEHRIGFDNIKIEWDNKASLTGWGYLTFTKNPIIYFKAHSKFLDINSALRVIDLWLDANFDKSLVLKSLPDTGYNERYSMILDLDLDNVFFKNERINNISTKIIYKKPTVKIPKIDISIYGGIIKSQGKVELFKGLPKFEFNGTIENMLLKMIVSRFTEKEYLTGKLNGDYELITKGLLEKEILSNIKLDGNYLLKDGELIGYLNFLKPIASLGKIINLTGPSGNSLDYESIQGKLAYHKQEIRFHSILMKGVGLDASGKGRIRLDGDLDFRIAVSLSGVAGKVIRLPIIYKGFFGRNMPYVDPVWLGSVYAGAVFLAGPAGATVGGIAGSAASDYINKAIGSMKEFFSSLQ